NVGRTFFLAAIGARYGVEAISKWHDPLGNAILTACFLSVWLLAHFISGPLPKLPSSKAPAPIPFPWKSALGLGIWVLFTVVAIEFWYRAHETQNRLHWSFLWPAHKKDFSEITISKPEVDELKFDEGRGAEWTNEDGSRWMTFFFRWAEGPAR